MGRKNKGKQKLSRGLIIFLLSAIMLLLAFSNCLFNFLMSHGDGGSVYIIPDESTYCSFKVIRMNDGSGDWWIKKF
jgi:hypothetical protein